MTPSASSQKTAPVWFAGDSIPLSLTITFDSDWHVGSGLSRLEADRTILRHPEDDLPWLPAKTVTGIWRDACEQVALGLDGGASGHWSRWVEILFGDQPALRREGRAAESPVSARLSVRGARLPQDLRTLLGCKENVRLKEALTFLKPGVKIDPKSGTSLDDHLRTEEVARAGMVLESEQIVLNATAWNETRKKQAVALLLAGTLVVERLGGKRRRGLGRCRWKLSPLLSGNEFFECLKENASVPTDVGRDDVLGGLPTAARQSPAGKWETFDLSLELLTPVVCTAATLGNVVESLDFIPGAYLLGAVAQRLVAAGVDKDKLTEAITRGDLRLLDARLQMADDTRGWPVPHALFHDKEKGGLDKAGGTVWNRMAEQGPEASGENGDTVQLKQQRKGYLSPAVSTAGTLPPFATVTMVPATHNVVDDDDQRPTEAVGGVYTYMAITQGQTFRSRLLVRQGAASLWPQDWHNRLDGEIRLGRAKKDDYGWVRLSVMECTPKKTGGQEEKPQSLRLWLLSDCLIRDERLRPSTQPEDLARCVGETLDRLAGKRSGAFEVEVGASKEDKLSLLTRTRRREGWHQGWGLPRPSLVGLAAGSCIDFTVTEEELTEDLRHKLEQEGLGERRAEGFGEIACNHPLVMEELSKLTPLDRSKETTSGQKQNQLTLDDPSLAFARILQKAAWRDALARAAMALPHQEPKEEESWRKKLPPNSQLGALRGVLASLGSWNDKDRLATWLDHLQETPNRGDKWEASTQAWLKNLTGDVDRIWEALRSHAGQSAFPVIPGETADAIKQELWGEALRALWGAVSRREQRRREGQSEKSAPGGAS